MYSSMQKVNKSANVCRKDSKQNQNKHPPPYLLHYSVRLFFYKLIILMNMMNVTNFSFIKIDINTHDI